MPGEKAVCVLLPNDSPVKGTIHFEQVSGEFLRFTENFDMTRERAFAIRNLLTIVAQANALIKQHIIGNHRA